MIRATEKTLLTTKDSPPHPGLYIELRSFQDQQTGESKVHSRKETLCLGEASGILELKETLNSVISSFETCEYCGGSESKMNSQVCLITPARRSTEISWVWGEQAGGLSWQAWPAAYTHSLSLK